jgi:signal transduction histidine kinase
MVNEALNNVRRHTVARSVWVTLRAAGRQLHLQIQDDAGRRQGEPAPPFLPQSLSQRTQDLGGTLRIERVGGLDTEIHISVPLSAA